VSEIVELRDGTYAAAKSRMLRHVSHALAVEEHGSAVT
jgi:hypothetical protein